MSIAVSHSGFNAGVTLAEIDLRFLNDFLGDAQVGKAAYAYVVDARGQVLAGSQGPGGRQGTRRTAAGRRPAEAGRRAAHLGHRHRRPGGADGVERGAETRLVRAVRAADRAGAGADPRPAGAERAVDRARPSGRDPRRHRAGAADADPDHRAARRRAAARRRRFQPSHRGAHQGRAGRTVRPVQQHGRPAAGNLCGPRDQGRGAHAGSGAVDQRAQGARGSRPRGVLLARSQRRAADGRGARAGNHPCRRGADLRL